MCGAIRLPFTSERDLRSSVATGQTVPVNSGATYNEGFQKGVGSGRGKLQTATGLSEKIRVFTHHNAD